MKTAEQGNQTVKVLNLAKRRIYRMIQYIQYICMYVCLFLRKVEWIITKTKKCHF